MNMRKNILALFMAALLVGFTGGVAVSAEPATSDDIKELKSELSDIKRELRAIRSFLQQRAAGRPSAQMIATVNIKEDPYLG